MPPGDPQRIWFPEMVDALRREWHGEMSFVELIKLRDRQDAMLHSIRSERHIRSPIMACPKCGKRGPAGEPHVSVRAMILSLGRFGIASQAETRELEKAWIKYQRKHGLDLNGVPRPTKDPPRPC